MAHAGDLLARCLERHGIKYVFGLPGGQTGGLYNAIANKSTGLEHILVRDECCAAYAADALARITGVPGVCDATLGPGAVKLTTGLMEAYNASIPMVAIVSNVDRAWGAVTWRGAASQAANQGDVLSPLSKRVIQVNEPTAIPSLVRSAMITAVSGRPGPVVLDFPVDVLSAEVIEGALELEDEPIFFPRNRWVPTPDVISNAVSLLRNAHRPLLVVGGGAAASRAESAIQQLAENLSIPVATTWGGKGLFPENHDLSLGLIGGNGTLSADAARKEADVVILAGFKHGQNSTFNWSFPGVGQKVIHIDIDGEEIERLGMPDVPLVGDVRATLEQILEMIHGTDASDNKQWMSRIRELREDWGKQRVRELSAQSVPVKPQRVVKAISDNLGAKDLVVADASFSSGWIGVFLETSGSGNQRRYLFPRGAASLGWGLPAAIGAWMSGQYEQIFVLAGDGAASYHLAEMATARRTGAKIIYLILNNDTLGWSYWTQGQRFDGARQSVELTHVDFTTVARGFGWNAQRVEGASELDGAVSEAVSSENSTLIEVISDLHETPVFGYREMARKDEMAENKSAY